MLLTLLHETISKRAKTSEELQQTLDLAGAKDIFAVDDKTVKIKGSTASLGNLVTPGSLPFKFEAGRHEYLDVRLGTLKTLQGMEGLVISIFVIGNYYNNKKSKSKPNNLESMKYCPHVEAKLDINNCPKLKSLVGVKLTEGASVSLSHIPLLD